MSKRAPQPTLSPTEAQKDSQALWDRVKHETRPLKRRKAPLAKAPAKPKQQAKPKDAKSTEATKGKATKGAKGKATKLRQVAPAPKPVKPQFPPKPNYGLSRQLDRDLKKPPQACRSKTRPTRQNPSRSRAAVRSFYSSSRHGWYAACACCHRARERCRWQTAGCYPP